MSRITSYLPKGPGRILLLVLGLCVFWLAPTYRVGYFSDDINNSLLPGVLKVEGFSLAEYIGVVHATSIRAGRFFPLQLVYNYSWFYFARDPAVHKTMVGLLIGLDLLLFFLLARRVARDSGFAAFATLVILPLFQFRAAFDPILAFFGLLPLIAAGLLASLLALQVYLDTNRGGWLALSALAYLVTILLYELSYPLFVLHGVLVLYGRRGGIARVLTALPFAVTGVAGFATSILLRWRFVVGNEALRGVNRINLNPLDFLATLGRQTSAALPLSYYLVNDAGLFPRIWPVVPFLRFVATLGGLTAFAGMLAASLASLRLAAKAPEGKPRTRLASSAVLGLLLAVLPAVLVSLSARHQPGIRLGIGYTPVYLQYFGVGWLLASAVWAGIGALPARGSLRLGAQVAAALLVAFIAGLTYRTNATLVASLEVPCGAPEFNRVIGDAMAFTNPHRRNLEAALRAGLVEEVPEHAIVLLGSEYPPWYDAAHSRYFFAMHGGKELITVPLTAHPRPGGGWFAVKRSLQRAPTPIGAPYIVKDVCIGKTAGYVVLSGSGPAQGAETRIYVRHPDLFLPGGAPRFQLFGETPSIAGATIPREFALQGDALKRVRSGRDWALFCVDPRRSGGVTPGSIRLVFGPGPGERCAITARPSASRISRGPASSTLR